MIDPSVIDERITEARLRDNVVTLTLLNNIARLPVVAPFGENARQFSLDLLVTQIKPGRFSDSGTGPGTFVPPPEDGSYAYQLYSAICFAIDARAELKLLELIASPDFYAALMRSAAEVKP